MPFNPAASITANARYGLHAESGERISTRVELPFCGLYIGTRTSADRLLWPQQTYAGASPPPHRLLWELAPWLVSAANSAASVSRPATNARPPFASWNWSLASWNALRS